MNPEQIKIIAVIVGTLLIALVMDSKGSSSLTPSQSVPETEKSNGSYSKPVCRKKGFNLYGKVQFVDSFPDLTIEYVSAFPDINVKFVSSFPNSCGEWQEVDSFPDFKVQVVSAFGDLKVKKVSSFPGME